MATKVCGWDGCDRPAKKQGHCNSHYERLRLSGRIAVTPKRTDQERLWVKINKTNTCWLWTGSKSFAGYGRIWWDGKLKQAHRVTYELLVGPIPEGLFIDHLCRVRGCVNPAHLEPVTNRENLVRGEGFAGQHARQTHCVHGHELSGDNLDVNSRGWRRCVTCKRIDGVKRAVDQKAKRDVRPPKETTCIVCGAAFTFVGKRRKLCSDECRISRNLQIARDFQRAKRARESLR